MLRHVRGRGVLSGVYAGVFFSQIAESYKEKKVICEIDGWVLEGVQFRVL